MFLEDGWRNASEPVVMRYKEPQGAARIFVVDADVTGDIRISRKPRDYSTSDRASTANAILQRNAHRLRDLAVARPTCSVRSSTPCFPMEQEVSWPKVTPASWFLAFGFHRTNLSALPIGWWRSIIHRGTAESTWKARTPSTGPVVMASSATMLRPSFTPWPTDLGNFMRHWLEHLDDDACATSWSIGAKVVRSWPLRYVPIG